MENTINKLKAKYKITENEDKILLNTIDNAWEKEFKLSRKDKYSEKKFFLSMPVFKFSVAVNIALLLFISVLVAGPLINQVGRIDEKHIQNTTSSQSSSTSSTVVPKYSVQLQTGFNFELPKDWSARISNQSSEYFYGRFYIPNIDKAYNYVDVESSNNNLSENPLLDFTNEDESIVNNINIKSFKGVENYGQSRRDVSQTLLTAENNTLKITLYHDPNTDLSDEYDRFVKSISYHGLSASRPVTKRFKLVQTVSASMQGGGTENEMSYPEELPFPGEDFKQIEVMGEEIIEKIEQTDQKLEDRFVKLYQFDAIKGQLLNLVASDLDNNYQLDDSIEMVLYDQEGKYIKDLDTRIEYSAEYTGKYYIVLTSKLVGSYHFRIFDKNQLEDHIIIKLPDGAEIPFDVNNVDPRYGSSDMAIVMQFASPVSVIDEKIIHQKKAYDFFEPLGEVESTIAITISDQTYEQFINHESPNNSSMMDITLRKISNSAVLFTPEGNEFFTKNSAYVVSETVYKVGKEPIYMKRADLLMYPK